MKIFGLISFGPILYIDVCLAYLPSLNLKIGLFLRKDTKVAKFWLVQKMEKERGYTCETETALSSH